MKIITKTYKLETNKKCNKKIVHISDIHYYNKDNIKRLNQVLNKISSIKCDYICITGDLIDEAMIYDEELLIDWLTKLAHVSKVIVSLGNHEFKIKRKGEFFNKKLFNKISKINNLYLLDNKIYEDNDITFIGFTNSYKHYTVCHDSLENFIEEFNLFAFTLDKNKYNILLCHSPIAVTSKGINKLCQKFKNIDLVLCGHMHGGIVPNIFRFIMKNRGFIGPSKKLFIKDAYGYIKRNGLEYIITSGITIASHYNPFRFINPLFRSEIVNIEIIKK